ncbi:MAG: hypothetical protein F6K04_18440 [Leptolyngbya sp. SIO4C5]|nr:hypothetical protein [Leptolyngbya sp. SIO4C5]
MVLVAACEPGAAPDATGLDDVPPTAALPPIETRADSVALRVVEASGGADALAAMPYLRFNFGVERDGAANVARKHLWNRQTGDYRVEWTAGADSNYVALFNASTFTTDTPEGGVYLNGTAVAGEAASEALQRAYRGYINDTYWLMAPVNASKNSISLSVRSCSYL